MKHSICLKKTWIRIQNYSRTSNKVSKFFEYIINILNDAMKFE